MSRVDLKFTANRGVFIFFGWWFQVPSPSPVALGCGEET